MDVIELALPQPNPFAADYMDGRKHVLSMFDYHYLDPADDEQRLAELRERSFPREALSDVLMAYNRRFSPSDEVAGNIEKLRRPDSSVVIGGQQAGLLTGPLYTIHKCISIIRLARKKEEQLGVPVVPVFWIAGEDHDFDEVNHTYVWEQNRIRKVAVPRPTPFKTSVSNTELNKKTMASWIDDVVKSFGEREHTKEIMHILRDSLRKSGTFTDFFAHILMSLFKGYGLVLVDSDDPDLRRVESPFFKQMIRDNEGIDGAVSQQLHKLAEAGYDRPIDVGHAHLFFNVNGERTLLERDETGHFRGKNNACVLTEAELLRIAKDAPEKLSNNVVTRPLMQELLFPTLAFIGGPGEIAYWGTFKTMFHSFGCRIPPVVPRLQITLVDRQTEKWLAQHGTSLEEAMREGVRGAKATWLDEEHGSGVREAIQQTKEDIERAHERLRQLAIDIDPHLEPLGRKNVAHLFTQVDYFGRQIERSYRQPYERKLAKFDHIEACLHPRQAPQERVWGVFPFLNRYGVDLIDRLVEAPLSFNKLHKVVLL